MKAVMLVTLTFALATAGCAGKESRIADFEETLREKEAAISRLQGDQERLKADQARLHELTKADEALSKELQDEIKKGDVTIQQLKDRVTVSVVEEVLFASGSAEIHPDGKKVLDKVAQGLSDSKDRMIMVEGNTDNVAIGPKIAEKFPTNWELSTARAVSVVRYLQDKGVPPRAPGGCGVFSVPARCLQ